MGLKVFVDSEGGSVAMDEIAGAVEGAAEGLKMIPVEAAEFSGLDDLVGGLDADAWDFFDLCRVGVVDVEGEEMEVAKGPGQFWIDIGFEQGGVDGQQIVNLKVIEAEEPVGLIKAVFSEHGNGGADGGQAVIGADGDIAGVIDSFEFEFLIELVGDMEDMEIGFGGGADDHLGALARRCE